VILPLLGVLVGAQVDVHSGSVVLGRSSLANQSFDLSATIGVDAAIGYTGRIFTIAFAPHYVPTHRLEVEQVTFSQLDLGLQLGIHNAIARRTELVGYVTPAYSVLYDADAMGAATGLAMTFSGGAVYVVSRHMHIGATLSYQYGAQHTEDGAIAATRLISLGLFVASR
jgi:hypothetical protein